MAAPAAKDKDARRLLRIGTRGSPLALAQAEVVRRRLAAVDPTFAAPAAVEIVIIRTAGDRIQKRALSEIGGKGLFIKEIEDALLDGAIDLAVHSMKDVPTQLPAGLDIPCMLEREDVRDVLIARHADSIANLPKGAVVGTASLRRQAQLLARRPDLAMVTLRGNVETRIAKVMRGDVDATLLALAGLKRLGKSDAARAVLGTEEMLPAVGQGAIGVEVRRDDAWVSALARRLNHPPTFVCVSAERACLGELEGNCRTPIAALAEIEGENLRFQALIATPDGGRLHRWSGMAPMSQASDLGIEAARRLRAMAGPDVGA